MDDARRGGYGSAGYARSLPHVGTPITLPASGGHLLLRPVPGTDQVDATGPYPLLSVARPGRLADDLAHLEAAPVSVTAVIDPLVTEALGDRVETRLGPAFPDLLRPFKEHHVADLDRPPEDFASAHHLRDMRRGLRRTEVSEVELEGEALARWAELYGQLVERHRITGPAAFPAESFAALARVPGLVAHAARAEGRIVGMQLWLVEGERAWYHLAATDAAGYRAGASYALMGRALHALRERGVRTALLGGGAGSGPTSADDGLARYKRGWATRSTTAWIGGRVVDPGRYAALCAARGHVEDPGWFPRYRHPATPADQP